MVRVGMGVGSGDIVRLKSDVLFVYCCCCCFCFLKLGMSSFCLFIFDCDLLN